MTKPKNEPVPPTLEELAHSVIEAVIKNNHGVSEARRHSVESHLHLCINKAGYRSRGTKEKPVGVFELAQEAHEAISNAGEGLSDEAHDYIYQHLGTVLSNIYGDIEGASGPALKDLPVLKEIPQKAADSTKTAAA
ncbi:MAG TPA: hypothetical protein VMH87_00685 [Pseudomonadales bacterium]|nr:hypothetical protein [Pseudomonadales bacterium]